MAGFTFQRYKSFKSTGLVSGDDDAESRRPLLSFLWRLFGLFKPISIFVSLLWKRFSCVGGILSSIKPPKQRTPPDFSDLLPAHELSDSMYLYGRPQQHSVFILYISIEKKGGSKSPKRNVGRTREMLYSCAQLYSKKNIIEPIKQTNINQMNIANSRCPCRYSNEKQVCFQSSHEQLLRCLLFT